MPPFSPIHINTFQNLKFIASHLPSGKEKKAQQFSGKSEKIGVLTEMATKDDEELWTKYEAEKNLQKNLQSK